MPLPRFTPGQWRRRSASSIFAVASFLVAAATVAYSVNVFGNNNSQYDLVTAQIGVTSTLMGLMLACGFTPRFRTPAFWHGASFIALAVISYTSSDQYSSPVFSYRSSLETMVVGMVAVSFYLCVGLLVLVGRPLCGTIEDPASPNVQLLFSMAVMLDAGSMALQCYYKLNGYNIYEAENDIREDDKSWSIGVGQWVNLVAAVLGFLAASSNFFVRMFVCTGQRVPLVSPILAWAAFSFGPAASNCARDWIYVFEHKFEVNIICYAVSTSLLTLSGLHHVWIELQFYYDEKAHFKYAQADCRPNGSSQVRGGYGENQPLLGSAPWVQNPVAQSPHHPTQNLPSPDQSWSSPQPTDGEYLNVSAIKVEAQDGEYLNGSESDRQSMGTNFNDSKPNRGLGNEKIPEWASPPEGRE